MKETFEKLVNSASGFIIDLLIALLIFVIGFRLISLLDKSLRKDNKFSKIDKTAKSVIISFINISLKILVIVIILQILGIPSATIVTVVGSCAVAIGLALQGGLSNIAGSIMILIFKPFKVGDYIKVGEEEGNVKSITIFYTTLVSLDNRNIQIPNGTLSNSNIVNYTENKIRRIDLFITVDYSTKIEHVKKVVNGIINRNDKILKDQKNIVRLRSHDESSLGFDVKVWVNAEDYWSVYYDMMENIKEDFDKNHISIPFNQLDVHIKK